MIPENKTTVVRVDAGLIKQVLKLLDEYKTFSDRKHFIDAAIQEKLDRELKLLRRAKNGI